MCYLTSIYGSYRDRASVPKIRLSVRLYAYPEENVKSGFATAQTEILQKTVKGDDTMDEYNEIGARLRELREVSDYTIEELAQELGLSPEVYASYEENGKDVPISVIYSIATKFKVDFTEICTGEFVMNPGDSIYFNPTIPHGQRCGGDVKARFLTVIAE